MDVEEPALGRCCKSCGKPPNDRPSIFKGLDYCSINCGKAIGDLT